DDARPSGVDVDPDPVPGTFDVHLGDTGALQAGGHHLTDLDVLGDVIGVQLVRVPARLPVAGDAEAEPVRVDLLTHYSAPSPAAGGSLPAAFFVAFFTGSLSAVFFAGLLPAALAAAFFAGLLSAGSAVFVAGLLPAASAAAFLAAAFFAGFFSAAGASASATAVDPPVVAPAVSSGRAGRRRGRDGRGAGATASRATEMWQVRLRIRYARPCARGRNRFMVGPSSTRTSATSSESGSSCSLFSALAIALAITFRTGTLAACGANCSTVSASFAGSPRTRLTTRRALDADVRTNRAEALTTGGAGGAVVAAIVSSPACPWCYRRRLFRSSFT